MIQALEYNDLPEVLGYQRCQDCRLHLGHPREKTETLFSPSYTYNQPPEAFLDKMHINEKHKGNHGHEGVFICDETHVDFHKTFLPRFSRPIQDLY